MLTNTILPFLMAFIIAFLSIRKLIVIAHTKRLFDDPNEDRKVHAGKIPNLGGVAIASASLFTVFVLTSSSGVSQFKYLFICALIVFVLGLIDDLVGVAPVKKLIPQIAISLIMVFYGGCRFTSLHGIFGINEIPPLMASLLSVGFMLLLMNAFNLIDGINWLAGTIGLLCCLVFAYGFRQLENYNLMRLSLAVAGSIIAFLIYNRTPARIFMGDSGSLFLGFITSILAITYVESSGQLKDHPSLTPGSAPALIYSLFIIPLFDTTRVFTLRLLQKRSPFIADRTHIHHRLIDLKFSHLHAVSVLLFINLSCVGLVLLLPNVESTIMIIFITMLLVIFNSILGIAHTKRPTHPQHNYKVETKAQYLDDMIFEKQITQENVTGKTSSLTLPRKENAPVT